MREEPTRPVETWNEFSRHLFGRHPEPAARCRELDDRGMFPGTLAP